jgi:2,3-bisphosphoglycerate-dependent phosphoglycerate mutase
MTSPDQPVVTAEAHRQTRWIPPDGSTDLLLIRHGATEGVIGETSFPLVDGHGDPQLSDDGVRQAQLVAQRLAIESIDALYVTNLTRTHQTAAPLAKVLGLTPIVEPELREVFLGEWEGGMTRVHAANGDPRWIRAMEEGEWGHIPGAETTAQLTERCVRALQRIEAHHRGKRVICVVHGGVIAAVLGHIAGTRNAFHGADNTSINHIVAMGDRWRVRSYNDVAHLGGYTPSTHL